MILIVTNKHDHTADFLILELKKRRADYLRFNTEDFPQRVRVVWRISNAGLSGYFLFPRTRLPFEDIRSVWYKRPVTPLPSTEIEDPAAIEFALDESQAALDGVWRSLNCFWVSDPDNLRRAEFKLYQLKVAAELGFQLSPTLLTNYPEEAETFYRETKGMLVYKPLRHAQIVRREEVGLIYTNPVNSNVATELCNVAYAPALLQQYVPKLVDVRAIVIGTKVFAAEIHSQDRNDSQHDWRHADAARLRHESHKLPMEIESKCVTLVKTLGLVFGAVDLILTPNNEYIFLEINPNGQWAWIQQLCPHIPLRETLADLLISCQV